MQEIATKIDDGTFQSYFNSFRSFVGSSAYDFGNKIVGTFVDQLGLNPEEQNLPPNQV